MDVPSHHTATSFVGREDTLAELHALVESGTRIITLTGPPGMGKTRVAQRFASLQTGTHWWCDLTSARSADDVVGMVAASLGTPVPAAVEDAAAFVGGVLANAGNALLVLDNVEQVAEVAGSLLGAWSQAAGNICFLVTSRERLQLPSEHVVSLPPLQLPDGRADGAGTCDAVALFVARASQVGAGFKLTPDNRDDVNALVARLDGIPLAIELAAARMRVMTPAEACARLGGGLDLLAAGTRDGNVRHRTLRAAVDWSWGLLSVEEQHALSQCSVFKGSFTLDACQAVLGGDAMAVVEVIQALVDKSLVARMPSGKTQRFRLYGSIAEFAAEKSPPADAEATQARWRAWVASHTHELVERLDGPEDGEALAALALEQDNLLHLLRDAQARKHAGDALQAVLALDPLLSRSGPFDVLVNALDAALALGGKHGAPDGLMARALEARGRVRQHRGRLEACVQDLNLAAELATRAGDAACAGRAWGELAALHRRRGDVAGAQALFSKAMGLVEALEDQRLAGRLHGELGILHKEQADLVQARAHYEQALSTLVDAGDRRHEGRVIMDLGALHQEEGRMEEARSCFERALGIHQAGGNRRLEALAWCDLGCLALEEGRREDSVGHLERSLAILAALGDRRTGARFEGILAAALASLDRVETASQHFAHSREELARVGDTLFLAAVDVHRGMLDLALQRAATLQGDHVAAAQLGKAAAARLLAGTTLGPAGEPSPSELSDDVRLAMRILRRALPAVAVADAGMLVGPQCSWFQMPGGERVDLANRRTPARLLNILVEQRLQHPGRALGQEALIAGGWPGERMGFEAALNRLNVTLATLRKLGLRSMLQRVEDGYLLDAQVLLVRAELS